MDWQKYFTLKTLDRGLAYYENGNVLELMQISHGYEAVVQSDSGNEYEVNIEIENDELIMNCDCIYGQEMGYCKHMAAVLYAVEEGAEMIQQHDLSKLINRLSTQKLREILLSVADQRAVKYKLQLLAENDPQTVLKQRLNQIIRKYSIAIDELESRDYYNFSEEVLALLEQDIYEIDDSQWECKAECVRYVLDAMHRLNLDEELDDMWMIFNTCYEMLGAILMKDESRLGWMKKKLNPTYYHEMLETIELGV
ncbi:SWIM zinc finger family protein [Dielma fastidiosa]|uniref:SWIM-type domain-containing protein n=1 Tax=Dielma fastidiosa TaxID=1034346 RepID=A0AB35UWU2_9FIRM|nr:SWIM zinc finger family protein [Dielma fastidiosa]MDY5169839.1 hypothetical protein [Dielma fastidiosa]